jgi:hypothetical protein
MRIIIIVRTRLTVLLEELGVLDKEADTDGPALASRSKVGTESVPGLGLNGYVCGVRSPSPNLGRCFFPSVEVFSN